jgi:hypothetical protein
MEDGSSEVIALRFIDTLEALISDKSGKPPDFGLVID